MNQDGTGRPWHMTQGKKAALTSRRLFTVIITGDGWGTSIHLSAHNAVMAAKDAIKTTHRTRDEVRELIVREVFTPTADPYKP